MPPWSAGVGIDYHRPFVCLCLLWVNVCEAQQSISKLRRGPSEWFLLCLCAPVSCDARPRQGEGLFVYCGCPAVSICPHLLSRLRQEHVWRSAEICRHRMVLELQYVIQILLIRSYCGRQGCINILYQIKLDLSTCFYKQCHWLVMQEVQTWACCHLPDFGNQISRVLRSSTYRVMRCKTIWKRGL